MKRYTKTVIAAMLMGCLAGCGGGSETPAPDKGTPAPAAADVTFFSGARLIPGDGSAPIEDSAFLVENGKFKQIGKKDEVKPPKGSARVDLTGRTIMPVLVNLHGHPGLSNGATFGPSNYNRDNVVADLDRYGYYGVSYVLALGTDSGDIASQIRAEQAEGKLGGAHLYTAGRGITAKGGWPTQILNDIPVQVSSEAEARKAVDDNADKKVDVIKIWVDDNGGKAPKLSPQLYKAIIDEAHKKNLKVVAHVFYLADAKDLVKSGVDGLMHSIRDKEVDDELISAMKEKNVILTPTLTAIESKYVYAEKPDWLGEQAMREVYPAQVSAYLADPVTMNRFKRDPDLAKYKEQFTLASKNLKKMSEAGVAIALGTDSGTANTLPGYFEHRELELMAKAGMDPLAVIKAGTSVPAGFIGLKDGGILAVGKNADFFVLSSNPLEKMTNSKEIFQVYKAGQEMDRDGLIRNITMAIPKITKEDRVNEAKAEQQAAIDAADAKLPHFGKFPLNPKNTVVRGMSIPTPKYSEVSTKVGPPDTITVKLKATAAEFKEFYDAALAKGGWKAAGACFERNHPFNSKTESLCINTAGAGSAVLQITEK